MSCDQKTLELLSTYVDGEATPYEAIRAEEHLGDCSECRATVQEWRHGLEMLDWAYNRALPENAPEPVFEPPVARSEPRKRRSFQWPSLRVLVPVTAIAAAILLVVLLWPAKLPTLGRQLATMSEKQMVLVAEGIRLEVLPNSLVTRLGEKAINLIEGAIKVEVTGVSGFLIKTRRLVITDIGTKFEVRSDANADKVTVQHGKVRVRQGEKEYVVGPGRTLTAEGSAGAKFDQRRNGRMNGTRMVSYLICLFLLIGFWLWMLVDALRRQFPDRGSKIAWVLAVLFGQQLGALVYCFVVYDRQGKRLGAWVAGIVALLLYILIFAIVGPNVHRASGLLAALVGWIGGAALIIGLLLVLRRSLRRQP